MAGSGAAATRAGRPRVVVVGAGAAGTLTAIHLLRTATRRATALDIVLVDPADRWARGVAFGTPDETHLLNVPSAGHERAARGPRALRRLARRRRSGSDDCDPNAFVPRRQFALYLDDTLADARAAAADLVDPQPRPLPRGRRTSYPRRVLRGPRRRGAARGRRRRGRDRAADRRARLGAGGADRSAFFVSDPWAPGALDVVRRDAHGPADVLVVGSGLTMVDVTLTLTGADGSGPPGGPAAASTPCRATPGCRARTWPGRSWPPSPTSPRGARPWPRSARTRRATSPRSARRPATGGPRSTACVTGVSALWGRLSEAERVEFLARDAGAWNVLRHRMAPSSKARLDALRAEGRLTLAPAEVLDAEPLTGGGLTVALSDGTRREVGWVVNCTGPQSDVRQLGDPLLDDLLRPRAGVSAGLGVVRRHGLPHRRRVVWSTPRAPPTCRCGPWGRCAAVSCGSRRPCRRSAARPRRSRRRCSTRSHRCRVGSRTVAWSAATTRSRAPATRSGLPLSTTAEAAAAYNAGLERVMRLQDGGEDLIREATTLDPDFAIAHAALAMLAHEAGADGDVRQSLELGPGGGRPPRRRPGDELRRRGRPSGSPTCVAPARRP